MRINILPRSAFDPDLAALVHQRFAFALGRFRNHVETATVRLTDLNGPRGGRDKRCAVAVRVRGIRRQIFVEDTDSTAASAITNAAARTGRTLARAIDALNDWAGAGGRR